MKDFLKFTLATVTGIILSSIVLFIIGMVTLFGIMAASDTETIVKKNSVMILDLNGTLVERTQEDPLGILSQLFNDDSNTYGLDDILSSIKKAKENKDFFMTKESKPVQQSGVNGNHENLIIYYIYFLWHQSSSIKMIEIYNMFNENKMDFY